MHNIPHAFVDLVAGNTLFIPAGWYHCVWSMVDEKAGYHHALNYWFHPPDITVSERGSKAYSSTYWSEDWKQRDLE